MHYVKCNERETVRWPLPFSVVPALGGRCRIGHYSTCQVHGYEGGDDQLSRVPAEILQHRDEGKRQACGYRGNPHQPELCSTRAWADEPVPGTLKPLPRCRRCPGNLHASSLSRICDHVYSAVQVTPPYTISNSTTRTPSQQRSPMFALASNKRILLWSKSCESGPMIGCFDRG